MDPKVFTPRLPKFYYSTYRQYKENESLIVQWLHRTVGELRASTRCAFSASSRRGRAHGNKSRTKTAGSQKAALDPDLASPKLSLRTLLDLAREISASDVVIPASYLALLELSIRQRKATAAFYSPDADVSEDNKAHLHAINAYSQVLKILREAEKKRAEPGGDLPSDIRGALMLGEDNFALSEAIQQLSVLVQQESGFGTSEGGSAQNEWIRDNPMVNSLDKRPKIPSFPLEEYGLILDDEFDSNTKKKKPAHDENFDRLRCFLLDVNDLRKYCNMVWKQVAPAGNLSHVAASFVTNMAVQIVKQMEYTLGSDFPSLKDIDHAYALLYNAILRYQLLDNCTMDQFDGLNDQMMYYTWNALQQFAELLKANKDNSLAPALKDGHFGYFDPAADRSKMSSEEKYREDRCIILNHWPDLIIVNDKIRTTTGSVDNYFLGSQGLVADFKKFCNGKTHTVTWALVFACQMQADSVQARRRYLNYDLQIMRNLGSSVLEEYHHFQKDGILYGKNMGNAAKPFVEYAVTTIEDWVCDDIVTKIKLDNDWDKYSKQATQKDSLWLQNPWLTANIISEVTLDYFYAGVSVASAGGFVQSTIQLWNMLREMGYLPPRHSSVIVGHDSTVMKEHVLLFDHLMDVFGEKVFSGPPPKSGFLKQWEIMTGIKAEEFARGKRQFKKTAEARPRSHELAGECCLT